jgi:hypothetical protein
MALADQLQSLIFSTSGINLETWSAQDSPNASSLTTMLKQAANLMVLQKYFDQWDMCLKVLGEKLLEIVLNNWNAVKVAQLIGEEPSPYFYSKVFAKFQCLVEESDLTPTQQNLQAQQMLDINATFGREVFPPSMIIPKLNITGKSEIIPYLQQQEQQMAAVQQEAQNIQHAFEEMKMKELMSKAANNLAMARERHGRSQADIGLYEERLSEITRNRALATKDKMEALEKMVDVTAKLGAIETMVKMNEIEGFNNAQSIGEDIEKRDAQRTSDSNRFMMEILKGMPGLQQQEQQMGGMAQGQ